MREVWQRNTSSVRKMWHFPSVRLSEGRDRLDEEQTGDCLRLVRKFVKRVAKQIVGDGR